MAHVFLLTLVALLDSLVGGKEPKFFEFPNIFFVEKLCFVVLLLLIYIRSKRPWLFFGILVFSI